MRLPPPWLLAVVAGGVVLLIAGVAMAQTSKPSFAHPAAFPPNLWGMKAKTGPQAAYLRELVAEGREVIESAGFPASVAIAQAMVETGWGGSMHMNPFGKRGVGDAGSVSITTSECYGAAGDACETQTGQQFAWFSSLRAACEGYVRFCSTTRYQGGHRYRQPDPGRWLLWLWGVGYATAPSYPSTVVDTSRRVGLTLGDISMVIDWNDGHRALLKQLQQYSAGSERKAATERLLGAA